MAETVLLSKKPTTTAMAANDTVVMVDASGNVVRINRASLAEAVRSVMATATSSANGLMSATSINTLGLPSLLGAPNDNGSTQTIDINTVHQSLPAGISVISCSGSTTNAPGGSFGVLINVARREKGAVDNGQIIFQLYMGDNSVAYKRFGRGSTADVVTFGAWSNL